jgi:hypothetical protein
MFCYGSFTCSWIWNFKKVLFIEDFLFNEFICMSLQNNSTSNDFNEKVFYLLYLMILIKKIPS